MFLLYQFFILIILILSPFIIIFRILKDKEDKKRFLEKFSFSSKERKKGKLIWFHGASVGEILSILPLIRSYENNKYVDQILVTSSTLSSSRILKKFQFRKTVHQFYPADIFFVTNKFLNFWKPSTAIFVDSEIWPCMFKNIRKKNIPLILLNARLTKKTFDRWLKLKNFTRSVFNNISIGYPQNLETKIYLRKLGLKKIKFLGNLKFAESPKDNLDKLDKKLKEEFSKKKVWVASSTHTSEELFCAKAHIELKKKNKKFNHYYYSKARS